MFKLESYITPILLDKLSKYVKDIRPEDLQVSLWEGEVALHNLDLRLDVLQEELNLPLEFISGHIHDLSIRVPWTKITSEPITIVINTIEFVLKLKNPREDGTGSSASSSPQRLSETKKKRKCPPKLTDEQKPSNPEATSSWIVSKIINNISLQLHNIILKYIEEDIVVSMNVQLLSFGSANEKWEDAMIDVHPVKVLMRKLVKVSDLTICLDKRNSAGQIDVCQEPLLYRSSFECRILLKYNANNPEANRITRIAVFTSLLDMNISSMQLPLCLRLIKMVLAMKENNANKTTTPETIEDCVEEEPIHPNDQSYLAWAWSMMPSLNFAPGYEDEPTNPDEVPCHTLDFGFYAEQLSFTLKNAEFVSDTHMAASKRLRYSPIVRLTIGGLFFEFVSAETRNWISIKAGVSRISVEPLGIFKTDVGKLIQTEESENQRPFIDKSLFDDQCLIADKGWGVTNYAEYSARITDDYLLYRSPVLAFDFIQYKLRESDTTDSTTAPNVGGGGGGGGGVGVIFENSNSSNRIQYRLLTAGITIRYTQTLEQVKQLISEFIDSYDYPAYYTETLDGGGLYNAGQGTKLPPPLMEDYDALMQYVPLRTYKFSLQRLTIEVYAKTEMDSVSQKQRAQMLSQPQRPSVFKSIAQPPHCVIFVSSALGTMKTPLVPDKLVHTTCQLPVKPQQLLDACYETYDLQVKDFSCSLANPTQQRSSRIIHMPNFFVCHEKLLQPHNWRDETMKLKRFKIQCEQIDVNFTRRELISFYYLVKCAYGYNSSALRRLVRLEGLDIVSEDYPKLQNRLSACQFCWKLTAKQNISNMSLYGIESAILSKNGTNFIKQVVFHTTPTKGQANNIRWLECDLMLPMEDDNKQQNSTTVVAIWLAPFFFRVDDRVSKFLWCEKFDELESESTADLLHSHVLGVPSFQSSVSNQSTIFMTTTQTPQLSATPLPLVRRSSRNSMQRRISHPEETIHVSSERDEKLEKDTSASLSARIGEENSSNMPTWLQFIKSYTLYVEIESGTVYVAQNLSNDIVLTKFLLPRIHLKPSNLETSKFITLAQLQSLAMLSKEKTSISWTISLSDCGIDSVIGSIDEALLQPIQISITIALLYKNEKLKSTPTEIKEETDQTAAAQVEKVTIPKESTLQKSARNSLTGRTTPDSAEYLSSASVTVGGRSDKSQSDNLQTDGNPGKTFDLPKSFGKQSPRRPRKNRDVYTFNLHADTTPIRLLLSSKNIRTLEDHLKILKTIIQNISITQQPNRCIQTLGEPISVVTATEENALLKDFMDIETNSENSKYSEENKETALAILLFCQWTITRITLEVQANPLSHKNSKVILDLEDLLSTIDKREDYTKITSKIGNLNVTYFEQNTSGQWEPEDGLTVRLLGEVTNLPFFNVIITGVGIKNFFRRIGAIQKGVLNRNLNEILIKMQGFEIIVNLNKLSKFVAAISGFFERYNERSNKKKKIEENSNNIIAAHELPMIHLDSKGFALYLPLDKGKDFCSVSIFRIESIRVTPNLENPLQRKPLRQDVFAKAAQLGMLGTPGSAIEDRQYELTLENISTATGSWPEISKHMSEQRDSFFRTNPAFEWNNQNRKQDLHITDIFNNFSFIAIFAPAIVYQNILISGQAIEFNCAKDFVASFNMYQLNMLSCLIVSLQNILSHFNEAQKKPKHVALISKSNPCNTTSFNMIRNNLSCPALRKSKPCTSTLQRCSSIALNSLRETTRSSSMFKSIDEDREHNMTTSDSGFQSNISHNVNLERLRENGGSVSTLSSLPQTQTRNVPQTISLVAGAFLIKFYNLQPCDTYDNDISNDQNNTELKPLISITLSQPSFMYMQTVYDSKMQVSLYDLFVSIATIISPTKVNENKEFNEIIIDTRPGKANAAGITPPLFTFRKHYAKMQLRECDIDIAKPIALYLTQEKVALLCQHVLLVNKTLLKDPCFDIRPTRNVVRGSKIRLMRQHCFDADRLHFSCRSIICRFQNERQTYNCKLVATDLKFNIKFLNRPEKATSKVSFGAVYLLVDQKAVLHPVNLRLSADFVSEPWYDLPLVTAIVKINVLQLDIGISNVLQIQEALKGYQKLKEDLKLQWQNYLRCRPFEKEVIPSQHRNLELLKCPPACGFGTKNSKTSLQREEFYQDDLRAGAFQFVEMNTDTFLPMPYQIQIIRKNFGIICWRYPQPRKMYKIHVYPVPMAMPNPIHIKCRMEYYSETHETFLQYCDFYLSETVSKQIQLPERQVCATIWRVVILQSLISVNGECFDDILSEENEGQKSMGSIKIDEVFNSERKESDYILHPKVLVACMRIDTTFESLCVSKIQFLLNCKFLTVNLINQPNENVVLPCLLQKYKLVQTTSVSQTFLILNFQNVIIHTALISSKNFTVESTVTVGIKCLDYGFLNMVPVLEDTTIQSCVRAETKIAALERDVNVNVVLNRMGLNLGPTIMHSLLTSKMHWDKCQQRGNKLEAIVARCIIVNCTYTFLTFGQTGTTERIQLQVREACMYSFRNEFHSQELSFFITDAETEMTEVSQPVPISFKFNGEVLMQPVRVGEKCIFIQTRKLSPMQIYVLIKGQIELISMVSHDLRLDFRRESTEGLKKSIDYTIERGEHACFYYSIDQKSIINMRLRFVDNTFTLKARSGDIPLRSNKNLPWLVKVPHAKFGFISFWVRVFREDIKELITDIFKPQKILVTIWPIFEICSMLSLPIEAKEMTTLTTLDLKPEGKCQALDVPATHLTDHPIKFNFGHKISKHSTNEFMLTLKKLEWKKFFYYDEEAWDVETVIAEINKCNKTNWANDDDEEWYIERKITQTAAPSIVYNCMPSRELSCTLRLEVSPWGYFINATSMDVSLHQKEENETVSVISNGMEMLIAIENPFIIKVPFANNFVSSAPIYFEDLANTAPSGSKYYVLSEKTSVDIVILRGSEVIKFMLSLKIESNRRMMMLRPKFVITNFTKKKFFILPFAMDHKETGMREHIEGLDAKVKKVEVQAINSKDDCIGLAFDYFYDLYSEKAKRTIDNAFIYFVCVKISAESDISIPIPLSMPFTRRCFSAQFCCESIAFAATLIENNGIHYLNIFEDTAPALLINNQTDMKFIIAQTNASENSKVNSTTPEFMGRQFEWHQLLKSYSNCYYTPSELYANFPDVDSTICNLTLALYKENISKKDIKWSKPIRTDKSWEKFLHIPNHGDVKIIICDKHRVTRISIFYILQQKEFSVKDLRSRLLTTQPISVDSDDSLSSIATQLNSPTNKPETVKRCIHHQTNETEITVKQRFRIHAYAKEIVFTLHAECKDQKNLNTEVLSIYIDDFLFAFNDDSRLGPDNRCLNLMFPNLQMDNQLHSNGKFDFPVIICGQELYERTASLPQAHDLDYIYTDLCKSTALMSLKLKFYDDEFSLRDVSCSLNPLRAYIEDAYLNELFDALVECVPSNCVYSAKEPTKRIHLDAGQILLPRDIAVQAICFAEPLQLRSFRMEPLDVLLSVHTSLRLYIALDHSPLSFSTYQREHILTMPLRFGQSLGMHYLSGAIFGAGWVVGSLEILGSPSGLARSFTTGLRDFVAMPVQGLFRGPWGFIVGITQGSASLLRNVTAGTVNSLTKLAASVARNLDRLTLDREHIERTEALRRVRPNSLAEGFSQGLTGLGISILGAVGGIAHHTLEARSPVEVVTGVGKGIVGALTKPISGAAELVALTGQGVLQTVGFNALPQQRMLRNMYNRMKEPSAYRIWKLLPSVLATDQVLFSQEITLNVQNQMRSAYVFLTSTVCAILVAQWDKLEFAYPINRIEITHDRDDKTLFFLRLLRDNADEMEDNLSYTNERIMNFIRSSHSMRDSSRFSMGSLQELLVQGNKTEEQTMSRKNLEWAFYMNEHLGDHLMHYLKILRTEI